VAAEILAVRGVSKSYGRRRWWGGTSSRRAVLRDVSFEISRGETLALVGPSGSGKSTLARCVAGIEQPDSGEIVLAERSPVQLIFQQPAASLNPRFTAAEIIEEPLLIQRRVRTGAAARAMEQVGLAPGSLSKRALEFSGGERQRLAIARALVLEPALLTLDESFAGLDRRLQKQVAALLRDLQQRLGLGYLVISHDLELVAGMAHSLAVIENGAIVEKGAAADVLAAPSHRLTKELIAAGLAISMRSGV
jgi:ABC-type glutathione transport system ATPase component